jgi:hypothetical protein
LRRVAANRPLLLFAICIALFHLANAAMLPLVSGMITMRSSNWATVLVAACIVVPQLVVAAFSPRVGRTARHWGRRPPSLALLSCCAAFFRRRDATVFALPCAGARRHSAAVLGVLVPVVVADLTRNTDASNLSQVVGTGVGIGARSAPRSPDTFKPIISAARRHCLVYRAQGLRPVLWRCGCRKPAP